jgi:hypothetical protein
MHNALDVLQQQALDCIRGPTQDVCYFWATLQPCSTLDMAQQETCLRIAQTCEERTQIYSTNKILWRVLCRHACLCLTVQ